MTAFYNANADQIAKLDEILACEYRNRLNTNGHGRRARIQETIDALERQLAALVDQGIGILNRNGRQVFYINQPTGKPREFASFRECRAWIERRRPTSADLVPSSWHTQSDRLKADGFVMRQDGDGFDQFQHVDGRTATIEAVEGPGGFAFTIARRTAAEANADRISWLVRRRRDLLAAIAHVAPDAVERIQEELTDTAAELERLSPPAAELVA